MSVRAKTPKGLNSLNMKLQWVRCMRFTPWSLSSASFTRAFGGDTVRDVGHSVEIACSAVVTARALVGILVGKQRRRGARHGGVKVRPRVWMKRREKRILLGALHARSADATTLLVVLLVAVAAASELCDDMQTNDARLREHMTAHREEITRLSNVLVATSGEGAAPKDIAEGMREEVRDLMQEALESVADEGVPSREAEKALTRVRELVERAAAAVTALRQARRRRKAPRTSQLLVRFA